MKRRLIGLCGYGGAGKSEVAKILREKHGFAGPHIKTPIRNMAASLLRDFGIRDVMIDRYLDGDLKRDVIPEIGKSGTYLQQSLGFDWGRDLIRKDLWLGLWLDQVCGFLNEGRGVVQESVRADDEASAIRSLGGLIVEVRRPGVGRDPSAHRSEWLPDRIDAVLGNDGTLDDLATTVMEFLAT